MLDFRLETFINLCTTKSYTKTANELCVTQPAVTQHIKYLEKKYNIKLFDYHGKNLTLTNAGNLFLKYVMQLKASATHIENSIKDFDGVRLAHKFGATRTIGEFVMPGVIKAYTASYPSAKLSMIVENTRILIDNLMNAEIEFAVVEGHFNRADFETYLVSMEQFVVVASPDNHLYGKENITIDDLIDQRIIIREQGSGSREIFERGLTEKNYSLSNFKNCIEIGNINVIKELVRDNIGISLMYKQAALNEINRRELVVLNVDDLKLYHEFNFIFLRNSLFAEKYMEFYRFLVQK